MKYKSKIEEYSDHICEILTSNSLINPENVNELKNYLLNAAA
jgi:hypothetical protein